MTCSPPRKLARQISRFRMRVVAQDIDEVSRFRASDCCLGGMEITFMSGLGFARLPKQGLSQDGMLIGIFEKS